jgi:hypothetical protein
MDFETKQKLRDAAFRRNYCCPRCGAGGFGSNQRDGGEIGGMPGIQYKVCDSCGSSFPIVKRRRRARGIQ